MTKTKVMSKACKNLRICLNLNDHQLKIGCYRHSLVMKHMVPTNQKSVKDIQEIRGKESSHDTIESHQRTRKASN